MAPAPPSSCPVPCRHREAERAREEKRAKEAALKAFLAEKRMREAETNEQKLEEARERFRQSQGGGKRETAGIHQVSLLIDGKKQTELIARFQ